MPDVPMEDLEFHYLIACKDGQWYTAADTETAVMPDGTVYDWGTREWMPLIQDDNPEAIELDLQQYRMLNSALQMLTNGEINA